MFDEIIAVARNYEIQCIILFGSRAKGKEREESDIDICVIADTSNKRRLAASLSAEIDCELPIDIIVYTPDEWNECIKDKTSFASVILAEGRVIYGQQKIS